MISQNHRFVNPAKAKQFQNGDTMNTTNPPPKFMVRENTCCFTGHRNIPSYLIPKVSSLIENKIVECSRAGYRYFICGGAYGFDMLAAEAIVKAIKSGADIHLILALPCRNQTEKWGSLPNAENLLRRYLAIKGFAEYVRYTRDFYADGCMKERNQFMIDNSSLCIAYADEKRHGGSTQTVGMAKRANIEICNLFPEVNRSI